MPITPLRTAQTGGFFYSNQVVYNIQMGKNMKYETLADREAINKTIVALAKNGIEGGLVNNRVEALEKVKSLIPKGASLMNGSSRTLEEIGFVDYLNVGNHG